jgi:hypothetical protein
MAAITGPGVITHTWEIPKLNGGLDHFITGKIIKIGIQQSNLSQVCCCKAANLSSTSWLVNSSSKHHFCS